MNITFSRGSVALALCLNLLAGCAYRGGDVASAAAEPVSAGDPANQGQASGRLLVWTADFSVEVADLGKSAEQLSARMVALGGYVEEKSDDGSQRQSFVYRCLE